MTWLKETSTRVNIILSMRNDLELFELFDNAMKKEIYELCKPIVRELKDRRFNEKLNPRIMKLIELSGTPNELILWDKIKNEYDSW
jgi:hypothetical protein